MSKIAQFTNKPSSISDVSQSGSHKESYEVMDTMVLTEAEWSEFTKNLLRDREWLQNYSELAMRARWYVGEIRPCIMVKHESDKHRPLLVDTQGFDYARYVAIAPEE